MKVWSPQALQAQEPHPWKGGRITERGNMFCLPQHRQTTLLADALRQWRHMERPASPELNSQIAPGTGTGEA